MVVIYGRRRTDLEIFVPEANCVLTTVRERSSTAVDLRAMVTFWRSHFLRVLGLKFAKDRAPLD
jgi:hypothetical protein